MDALVEQPLAVQVLVNVSCEDQGIKAARRLTLLMQRNSSLGARQHPAAGPIDAASG